MNAFARSLLTEDRLNRGYVIILPGIEGYSWLNRRIRNGLLDAELPYGIEIHDWTRRWPLAIYNLRSARLHSVESQLVQRKIATYQQRYPRRPVFLIGHSGGGAMTLRILETMEDSRTISGAVLLGAAISPHYDYRPALRHVDRKIWNFSSFADCLFLGLLTLAAGTLDGHHSVSAGMVGFSKRELTGIEAGKIQELPYRWQYCQDLHLAGHFGFTSRRFVKRQVAPLLMQVCDYCEDEVPVEGAIPQSLPNPATT